MIMFFDLLMLDDVPVLNITGNERRKKLEAVVHRIPGRADFAHRRMISFSNIRAAELLREAFAESIRANEEGLIMKPADEPYFDFDGTANFRSCCIKMKKQYIGNFGDVGDFAVVGGAYVASDALKIGIPHLKWTHLFLGCLENKDQVSRWNANPKFVIIAAVTPNADILKAVTRYANPHSVAFDDNDAIELRIEKGVALGKTPSHVFKSPLVFDMRCFGFDKEGNTGFWTLRFPQASKIHFDRDWKDTVSFGELQRLAEASRTDAEYLGDDKSQEDQAWISRLEDADPRGVAVDACTQRSVSLEASLPMVVIPERKGSFLSESEEQCDIQCSGLSPKRISPFVPRTQTPVKRQRLEATFSEIAEKHKKIPKFQSLSQPSPRIPTPLSEITNGYFTNRSDLVASTTRANSSGTPRRKASSFSITSTAIDNTSPKSKRSLLTPSDNLYQKQPTALFPCSEVAMNSSMSVDDIYFAPSTTSFASRILSRPQNLLYTPLPCVTAGQNCSLLNAAVLLAPCIATVPWLVEDLLPSHGVPFTTDPISFLDSSKFPRRCPASKKRIKKIILVESNRRDAMLEFMRNVEHLGTRNKNGHTDKTELIAVYDYRLVESLWKMEKGRACDHDIWKRNSIGSLQTFIAAA
jgi:DNA ligase-4